MYSCNTSSFMVHISVILLFCLFHNVCCSCVFQDGKYDLSALDRPTGWPVEGRAVNGTRSWYEINLCHPLNYSSPHNEGCPKSSICHIVGNKSISFGNALENKSDYAIADNIGNGFSLYVLTKDLCLSNGIYRATIYFACGPNLGAPKLILLSECQVNFYWRTSAACTKKDIKRQVPCYVLDNEGHKRDLSHLILKTGGYFVNTPNPALDFFINVCSDITLDNQTQGCPENASACRLMGNQHLSFGSLHDGLQNSQEGLMLSYTTDKIYSSPPDGCHLNPRTTILFKCPSRGHSQPPKLISDSNCQYEVEWETEYACPENILKGSFKTCQFTTELHGVEIDLSPLKGKVYHVNDISNSTKFSLSVCGGIGNFSCAGKTWKSIAVCAKDSNSSQIIGTTDDAELLYADGEVTLIYQKGSTCEYGMERSSVINFICDPQALNDGMGEPQHISSKHCIDIFQWPTKHACLKHPLDTPCSVTFDKKKVNLQKLLSANGEAWQAIDRREGHTHNAEYYINVCGQITSNLTSCGEDASACVLFSNGTSLNLGNFTSPPEYDAVSNSVRLRYTGGSPCKNGKNWQSSIEFICRPGHINSEPILARISEADCLYEFEWQTAEACPEGMIEGSDCKVYDANLGINYDLSPLKSKVYEIDSNSYKYYMGICEPVVSPCSSNKNSTQNVGVCQVNKLNNSSWKTGEPTSRLSYMDGVVNLTYLSGDPYNDQNKTARMTIIIFICDYKAGNGHPYFIEEINFAYVFHWYTSLVCPYSVATECLVHDPFSHLVYDLSGLALTSQNWMTIISEDNKERQIYLNVCRSLAHPTSCDSLAAVCMTETSIDGEKVIISNLGRATNPPVLNSPGHLTLKYSHGNPCTAFGQNITYSTVIHFLCAEDKTSKSGLQFLSRVGACEYTFLWTTKAACPTGELQSKDMCQLTDPDSGFTFDLTSLRLMKHFYTVSSPSRIFNFNICGKVVGGCSLSDKDNQHKNISVCEVDKDGKMISEIALADSYTLSYSTGKDLSLTYKSHSHTSGEQEEVVIKFPCQNTTSDPKPKFIHHENGQFIFEMKTPLTCIPSHFDCNFVDKIGNEYDLSPLAKYSDGNWEVVDSRPEYSHFKYHINFCRPLNKVLAYKCPGGASAACQTNSLQSESSGHDLGSQMIEPIVNNKGIVVIRYTDGSYCDNVMFKRSTTINLFCSGEQGELAFLGENSECEYIFSLHTPVACPIQSSLGHNCIVKDPTFGYTFDLNPLKSKNRDYNVSFGDYTFSFNVCDKLNGFNNECANAGACQMKPGNSGFSKSLGLPSDVLVYRKGLITLEYTSGTGNCHGKFNRSTKITFTCHHAHEDKDGPTFVAEAENCSYLFEWPTVHACPPFDVIECSVVDKNGVYYDLSKLSLPSNNYYVKYPDSDEKTFVINICRSIVHTPNSLCPYTSASCLVDSSRADEPINLGRVNHSPYFENGKIKINYTSGDPCDDEKISSARFMQTIIEFTCDPFRIDGEPEFVGKDDCNYYFDWITAYACPSKIPDNTGDCTAQDPITGYLFNLTSLKTHGLFKTQNGDHEYYLSICGIDNASPCGSDAGVCQQETSNEKRHWNGGKPNANLTYNEGILYLNYSGGDSCHNGKFERNTIIEFHCGHGIGEPKFLYESHDCTYFFSWKTELVCQTLLHCAIKNGSNYYDLTSLAESYHTAGSSIPTDDASYYISVCNSLPKIPNISCPPGAAICRVMKDSDSSAIITESLGRVEYPPFVDFVGHATVIYSNGSICSKDATLQNRARIIFLCDSEAGAGEPVLLEHEYDECFYIFEWRTNVVCPEEPEVPKFTSCNYTDHSRGIHFDLLPLQKTGANPFYEVFNGENQNSSFFLNVCANLNGANLTKCDNAGICAREGSNIYSYGNASSQKFTFDGRRLRLTFYDGDDCPSGLNGKRTSEIFFICDPSAGMGSPVLHKKYSCLVVFMWKTILVCQNTQQQCSFDENGIHYDFNLLSSLSHNWNTSDAKNVYWINLCRGIQPTGTALGCSSSAAVCMMDPNGLHLSLGMVQTMQVKTVNSTDLLLTFDNGDKRACSSVNPDLHAITRLFMRCGTSLGTPKIFSGPDTQCFYDFVWKSSLACADKAEEVMMEKDGLIKDRRLEYYFNIRDILNRTFNVPGVSTADHYVYKINLSGVSHNVTDPCGKAAVCQTKNDSHFLRDIGSLDTRKFILRGSELHLSFVSHTRPCGKNRLKNVTTLINMQCVSAAGVGSPKFMYESGNCDYIFEWETIVVCPDFHRPKVPVNPTPNHYKEEPQPSHKAEIVVGVLFGIIAILIIAYIVTNSERRAVISSRFRSLFGRVSLPYFRYKRGDILTELQSDF